MINLKLLIIILIILFLFGGKKIPEFIRGLGEANKELKKTLKEDKEGKTKAKNG